MAILTSNDASVVKRRLEFDDGSIVIGRHPDCDIIIDDASVSRRHAQIDTSDGVYFIEDLDSRNGTFLNSQSVHRSTRLFDGSEIVICDVRFIFHLEENSTYLPPRPTIESELGADDVASVEMDEDSAESSHIVSQLDIPSLDQPVSKHVNAETKLQALMQIARALSESVQRNEVFGKILGCLFDLFSEADRGFIIMRDEEGSLRPVGTQTRNSNEERLRISKTIINKVMETQRPLLSSDAASDGRFDLSQSLVDFRIRSIMCAPLINSDGESIGVIQLDTLKNKVAFDEKDLEILVTVAMQASLGIQKLLLVEEAVKNRKLEDDLKLAHEVQQAFLPQRRPNFGDYQFYSFYRATNQVGGDYFDYVRISDEQIAIIIADVVGHGIAAALLMAKVAAESRFALAASKDSSAAVKAINENLSGLNVDRFATALIGILDKTDHSFTYANAGHMHPVVRKKDGEVKIIKGESGLPVGVMEDVEYEATRIDMELGDVLMLFTDGINESMNDQEEILGMPKLLTEIQRSQTKTPGTIGKEICQITNRHMGSVPPYDDMCLVCFGHGF